MKIVTSLDQITREEQLGWLNQPYAIDVETEGLDFVHHDLIGVAMYVPSHGAYYFVRKHTADDGQTVVDYLSDQDLSLLLNPLMSQGDCVSILHNSKYDLHFFHRFNLPLNSRNFDTLMAAKLLDEERQNGLKQLASLVDEEHAKYETKVAWTTFPRGCPLNVPLQPFAEYAMQDVVVTYKLYLLFREELTKDSWRGVTLQDIFNTLYMPLVPVLREMEARGFMLDLETTKKLYDDYSEKLRQYEQEVRVEGIRFLTTHFERPEDIPNYYWKIMKDDELEDVYTNEYDEPCIDIEGIQTRLWRPSERSKYRRLEFNIGSDNQIADLLYSRDLGLPSHVSLLATKTGADSVNVDNLKTIKFYLKEETPSYVNIVLEWRKASKFVNTYLKMFLESTDSEGALHGMFNMATNEYGKGGTRTGRLSSSNPNLQQIPSRGEIGGQARDLFIARPGHSLIVADYSNMETVVMAHYSGDVMLTKAFEEGLDVHSLTACGQHDIPYDKFLEEYHNGNPQYKAWRATAKTILFGTAYGMGAMKLQRTLLTQNEQEYELDEVKRLLKRFDETYEGLTNWKKDVILFVQQYGFVATMYGRKRRLPLALSHDRERASRAARQGVNAIVQGTCADILFEAMPPIQAYFKSLGGGLIASVHDELIGEIPDQYAEAAAQVMSETMVGFINPKLRVKLKAEAGIGKTWGQAKG